MTILERILLPEVPDEDKPIVNAFRKFLGDTAELNTLKEVQENDDLDLYRALLMTLEKINNEFPPLTMYNNFTDIPSVTFLFMGGMLSILISKSVLSARNTLTYNDAGGITVQDFDTYGRYTNLFNYYITSFVNGVRAWKKAKDIADCYGGVGSEYMLGSRYEWE